MHVQEKRAWITLGLFAGYIVLFLAIFLMTHSGKAANIAFWLWIPIGIEPWLKRKKGQVVMDERDRDIERRANETGFTLGFWLFVCAVNVPVVCLDYNDVFSLPLWQLMAITNFLVFVPFAVRSFAVVCLYRFWKEFDATTD